MLAMKAYRDYAREVKGIKNPVIVSMTNLFCCKVYTGVKVQCINFGNG
jgi:hypothetical protein